MKHFPSLLLFTAAAIVSLGCGGSGENSTPSNRGKIEMSITWPASAGRFIPNNADHVRVEFTGGPAPIASFDFDRQSGNLPNPVTKKQSVSAVAGTYTVHAYAYHANPKPTESPLSEGQLTVTVSEGASTDCNIVLDPKLTRVLAEFAPDSDPEVVDATLTREFAADSIVPAAPITIAKSSRYRCRITPKSGSNDLVLFKGSSPSAFSVVSSDTTKLSLPGDSDNVTSDNAKTQKRVVLALAATATPINLTISYADSGSVSGSYVVPVIITP